MTITMQRDRSITLRDIFRLEGFGLIDESDGFGTILDMPLNAFRGNEEGTNIWGDIVTETKDGFPLAPMWVEFQKTIALWNRQRNALVDPLTYKVQKNIEGVRYPIEQDFEEASEMGVPGGIRLGPAFRMGFGFKFYDLAIRYTWQYLLDVSADELRALHNTALEADNRLMFSKVMKQIFNNTTRVANIDNEDVNVYPFYNGDTMVPPKWKVTTFSTGHQHYVTSGAGTIVGGDLDDIQALLTEHGYTVMNGYQLLLFVNPQEGATIRGFVRGAGVKYDFIPTANVGGGIILSANGGVIGAPTLVNLPGLLTIGSYGQMVIIEEEYIPAGYIVALASKGPNNIGNPVGIREHEQASARGLQLVKGPRPDYPLIDSYYLHGFGTGIRHRGAGAVMQISAAGSYTTPAAYA